MIIPSRRRALCVAVATAAAIGGTIVALHYSRLGLTLSHYDARGHLIVARRIIDSLTPGWKQIGAVWLPLPHLINAIPSQVDSWYRSGAFAVAISVASQATAAAAVAWIVATLTASSIAALCATVIFTLNPNLLYLQATPMTEPLLLGLILAAVAMLIEPVTATTPRRDRTIGWLFALACLTRYEAWPITGAALVIALWASVRSEMPLRAAVHRIVLIGRYPTLAILLFLAFSKAVVGQWFVSSGFFIPENPDRGQPLAVITSIVNGVSHLSGHALMVVGGLGLALLVILVLSDRRRSTFAVPLSILSAAALPFLAFLAGHPFRIRYMVTLLAAQAIGIGFLVGRWKRLEIPMLCIVAVAGIIELRPLSANAPMVLEAQWDVPSAHARQEVTACLREQYDGETILASMGSLGHYMQELSQVGLELRDFLHEGNGQLWQRALTGAKPFVGWVLISERRDGRDALLQPSRSDPHFLEGFTRVCEGGQVALYRRVEGR